MDRKKLKGKRYKTAWEAITSDLEGILAKVALKRPDLLLALVDGSPAFFIEAPTRLDRKGLLEYLEAAPLASPEPLKEVALCGLWCDPPKQERYSVFPLRESNAVAYRPPVRMPWGLPFPTGKTNA